MEFWLEGMSALWGNELTEVRRKDLEKKLENVSRRGVG